MLKQKFILAFGAKLGIALITAVTGIVVARLAGPEVVGTIGYATAFVSIFSFITSLFGPAHVKLVSEGQNEADCLKTYAILQVISVVCFSIGVMVYLAIQKYLFGHQFENPRMFIVICITLITVSIGNFFIFSQTVFDAKTEQVKANAPEFLRSILYSALRIIVVALSMGVVALALTNLISCLVVIPYAYFLLRKLNFGKFDASLAKKYLLIAYPILSIVIVQSLMTYSDKIILEYFGDTKQIGYYSAAFSIGGMLILLGNTIGTLFFPIFSSLLAKNDSPQVATKIFQFERFIFIFILPIIMGLSLFAHPIMVTLLSSRYAASAPMFSLLVFSSFFIIWGMPYANVISALGLFWLSSRIYFVNFFVFSITLLVCIHPKLMNMGGVALAITQVVMNLFLFLAYYYFAWKKINVQFIKEQFKFILFWVILYGISYYLLIPNLDGFSKYIGSFVFFPLFLISIYVLYVVFGLLKRSDITILFHLLSPKASLQYVRSELKQDEPS